MGIKVGLVGLPNVGKSTLFNALTKSSIPAENFPFCTIDPNVAITPVPDERLDRMAQIFGSQKLVPATIQFVDIAGLVKGASKGEGLGNKFLSHILEVDLVVHVLRCFLDKEIVHTQETVDPLRDFDIILCELMLKDLESLELREQKLSNLIKKAAADPKLKHQLQLEQDLLLQAKAACHELDAAKVRQICLLAKQNQLEFINLLSAKNFIIAANFAEDEMSGKAYQNNPWYSRLVERFGQVNVVPVCAKIEADLSGLSEADAAEMRASLELESAGLGVLTQTAFVNLGLICFFTCGPKEAHAWPIKAGINVQKASGEIHSDLERGFIRASVYNVVDIFAHGSEEKLRDLGKLRTEGRDYIVADGDVLNIKFNV